MSQEKYKELLKAQAVEFELHQANRDKIQAGYDQELAQAYKKAFPKRKPYTPAKFKDVPDQPAIFAKWQAVAKAEGDRHQENDAYSEYALDTLALTLDPWTIEGETCQYTVGTWAYNSQGMGAGRYAQGDAANKAEFATAHGLKAEVRQAVGEDGKPRYAEWGVFVNTDDAGWDLITRKPGPTLREWLKGCWKKGVNPRVFNPFLPPGLEEKLGLDYFGGEKAPKQA